MSNSIEETEPEWIKGIKSKGSIPFLKPDNTRTGWSTPSPNTFMVRGPNYFTNKIKVPADDYLLKPLGFDWIKGPKKLNEILTNPNNRIRQALGENEGFVWAFNLQLPHKDNYSAIAYFVSTEPIIEGSLTDRFIKGDDSFKKSRLKLIANIVKGPWIVRKAVGEQAICVIGRALSCKYVTGENFVEVDIDIGSSMIASAIVQLAFGYVNTLTVDIGFVIESQCDDELPEKVLGGVRFCELQTEAAVCVELDSDENGGGGEERSSWWKSIGSGISHLIHQDTSNLNSNGSVVVNQKNEEVKK